MHRVHDYSFITSERIDFRFIIKELTVYKWTEKKTDNKRTTKQLGKNYFSKYYLFKNKSYLCL